MPHTATCTLLLAAIAVWGTMHGWGPFVRPDRNESMLLVQAFLCVVAGTGLLVAAAVGERRQIEEQLRHLAVSDPLTGLANYRGLAAALEREIRRAQRTGRPLALLFLDLDGLKQVNDHFGHLIGSRALTRVGDALRATCRAMDTPTRFGGDEFAVVLPETGEIAALRLAARLRQRLAADPESPPITVSVGVALYPRDGDSAEALLGGADRALYAMKRRARSSDPRR